MKLMAVIFLLFFLAFGMEKKDLFKLSAQEFKNKIDSGSKGRADRKPNRGSFYKAEKDGKIIYLLGTIKNGASQNFIEDTVNKVKKRVSKDGKVIKTYWTEFPKEKAIQIALQAAKKSLALQSIDEEHPKFLHLFNKTETEVRRKINSFMTYAYQNKLAGDSVLKQLDTEEFWEKYIPLAINGETHEAQLLARPEITELYFKGDNFEIANYIAKLATQGQIRDFTSQLELETRNKQWVDMLTSENADTQLVVVDNLHTWFKTGVLMLLKQKSWNVKQVDLILKAAPIPTLMEDEDLFKLSAKEFKDAIDLRAGTLRTSAKRNKGTFFKATKGKKTIYYLGSLHFFASQDFINYAVDKIYTQLKKDGNHAIGTLWTELAWNKIKQVHIGDAKQLAENSGRNDVEERIKETRELIKSWPDHKFPKEFMGKAGWKFLDTIEVQERIRENLKKREKKLVEVFNGQSVGNAGASKDIIQVEENLEKFDPFFPLAKAYHTGNYFEIAKLMNARAAQDVADQWDIIEFEKRNQHWVDLLQSENSDVQFVVAGAGHAFYNTGVLMLLKENGWEIEHIDLNIPDFSQAFKTDYAKFILKYNHYKGRAASALELLTVISSFFMLLLL